MNQQLKKSNSNGPLTLDDQQKMIIEVCETIKKLKSVEKMKVHSPDEFTRYCSDAFVARYLRARNWNVKKAIKMLEASLVWRINYKPEQIQWEHVAAEAETGKIYRSNYKDKNGRVVLVMRPRFQNSTSIKGQVKYLVYCMENAILNLPADQEQMIWLIDFHEFKLSNISIKSTKETAFILQEQYPERLGLAILYNPPKFFEPFYKVVKPFLDYTLINYKTQLIPLVVKPFLEPKTANKVKFVYSDDPNTKTIMGNLFCMDELEYAFGGKGEEGFEIKKYAEMMKEDDAKRVGLHGGQNIPEPNPNPNPNPEAEKATDTKYVNGVNEEEILAEDRKIEGA